MNSWKDKFDNQMKIMESDFERDRHDLEVRYNEELKERLQQLQERARSYLSRMEEATQKAESGITDKVNSMEQKVQEFTEQYNNTLLTIRTAADDRLNKEIEEYGTKLNQQFVALESGFENRFTALDAQAQDAQNINKDAIDTVISDLKAWKERLSQQGVYQFQNRFESFQ